MGLGPANKDPAAVTPRIVSFVSPPWPVTLTATPGIMPSASDTLWMLDLSRSAPPITEREIGTSWMRCSRFCAVTTISSSAGASDVASAADAPAASAGKDENRSAVAGSNAAPERNNAEYIFHPFQL